MIKVGEDSWDQFREELEARKSVLDCYQRDLINVLFCFFTWTQSNLCYRKTKGSMRGMNFRGDTER